MTDDKYRPEAIVRDVTYEEHVLEENMKAKRAMTPESRIKEINEQLKSVTTLDELFPLITELLEMLEVGFGEMQARDVRYREALEFYADPKSYEAGHNDDVGSTGIDIDYRGNLAREALKEVTR